MQPVFVVLIIIGVAIAGYFAWRYEMERRKALRRWARRHGWRYTTERRTGWEKRYEGQEKQDRADSESQE